MKILDCTLRDGGYYTNWDFGKVEVDAYFKAMQSLPIDYVEVGYRSFYKESYRGKYYYSPQKFLKDLRSSGFTKKIAVMLNAKEFGQKEVENLENLFPDKDEIAMVRIAVDPKKLKEIIPLINKLGSMRMNVGLNLMYLSQLELNNDLVQEIKEIESYLEGVYFVDSYGSVTPTLVAEIFSKAKKEFNVPLGFHGHNNIELAFANSLAALEEGAEFVDATILGMGRGAGNLRTELFLAYMNAQNKLDVNLDELGKVCQYFESLKTEYQWGTNFPYILSGSYSIAQGNVMEWVSRKRYSMESIVRKLSPVSNSIPSKANKISKTSEINSHKKLLFIGGGNSVEDHSEAIVDFLNYNLDVAVVHLSTKKLQILKSVKNNQYLCTSGYDGINFTEAELREIAKQIECLIYPPAERTIDPLMQIEGLDVIESQNIGFAKEYIDSPLAIATMLANQVNCESVFLVGVDGYNASDYLVASELNQENQEIINKLVSKFKVVSLTPTKYLSIETSSIYAFNSEF